MLLISRPQADIVAKLRSVDVPGMIGPASTGGWCAMDVPDDVPPAFLAEGSRWIDVVRAKGGWLIVTGVGEEHRMYELTASVPADLATDLATAFGRPDAAADVEARLNAFLPTVGDQTFETDLLKALADILTIPDLGTPHDRKTVVVRHGKAEDVRLAASVIADSSMAPLGEDWHVLTTHDTGDAAAYELAAGMSAASRKAFSLLLIREAGFDRAQLWRHGDLVADWNWGREWVMVMTTEGHLATEREFVAELSRHWPGLDPLAVKTLLRADPATTHDLLERLLRLLGMPDHLMSYADEPDAFPGNASIARTTVGTAVRGAMASEWQQRWDDKPAGARDRSVMISIAIAVAFLVGVVVAVALGNSPRIFVPGFFLASIIAGVRYARLRADRSLDQD